jgi:hypothetical protein
MPSGPGRVRWYDAVMATTAARNVVIYGKDG